MLIQLRIMRRQTRLMNDQLKLSAKQDEIIASERLRRADLVLRTESSPLVSDVAWIKISAFNRGTKTARDFYWHIWVRADAVVADMLITNGIRKESWEALFVGDVRHVHYQEVRRDPLYPQRATNLCGFKVFVREPAAPLEVTWQITGEDGMYPDAEKPGVLTLKL